jgi:hyperosmotically inducible periplasmic protein
MPLDSNLRHLWRGFDSGIDVKIITQNGQVTLKGPVRSEDEKKTVETKATEVAGENKVNSELDIKPKN